MEELFQNNRCFIIAEAGVNHNGSLELATKLIDEAKEAGADAIKFQTFKTESLVTKDAPKAEYQMNNTGDGTQFEMLKKLELSLEDHIKLKEYAQHKGIMFVSTPFDFESVDLLEKLGVLIYKVSSGDLTNIPLLRYIAKFNKPIILSTGMANLGEVELAVNAIKEEGNDNIILLHCTSNYPTDYEDVNLKAMITLKDAFKLPVGYSDHTTGIEVPIAAVAMGARVIEKHFTLDRNMEGPDHKASLDPIEFRNMVRSIRNIEKALGDGIKRCSRNEENTKFFARRCIVAKRKLNVGEKVTYENIDFKRPEKGISPVFVDMILNKTVIKEIDKDEPITFDKLSG